MLCLKIEAFVLPMNLSIQKAMHNTSAAAAAAAGSSGFEDVEGCHGGNGTTKDEKSCCYRFHLEQEVRILQKQLQEEIDLHFALANAVGHNIEPLFSPSKIPDKAQNLLDNISELEATVIKLEKELAALHFRFSHERNERLLAENNYRHAPLLALESPTFTSAFTWEEHISSLRLAKANGCELSPSSQLDLSSSYGQSESMTVDTLSQKSSKEKVQISELCTISKEEIGVVDSHQQSKTMDPKKNFVLKNLWQHPNKLSEEMVRCMRDIFLSLSESSSTPKHHTSELNYSCDLNLQNSFDPCRVNGKFNWRNNGTYGSAAKVYRMSVGKEQLDYAAEALKEFRFLVEQLTEVNPGQMTNSEKLAFWINLYNALIMHAYLAYGVPKNDAKLFSLMQKASYTVGGQSLNAADIEFVLLKMKPPAYRPQIGLVMCLHKFKTPEEHRMYSIDSPEPLLLFALSSGMYSSPAVKVFTPDNVADELKKSMKDYIQASVGISDRGKLLVPKLLHCFARDVVEDSLLVDWICRHLNPDQVSIVRDSASHRKQRLLGALSFSVIPFDSRFRYLFLPEN